MEREWKKRQKSGTTERNETKRDETERNGIGWNGTEPNEMIWSEHWQEA